MTVSKNLGPTGKERNGQDEKKSEDDETLYVKRVRIRNGCFYLVRFGLQTNCGKVDDHASYDEMVSQWTETTEKQQVNVASKLPLVPRETAEE
jgi:hypothetical protein